MAVESQSVSGGHWARGGLVPAARTLVVANVTLIAVFAWTVLPRVLPADAGNPGITASLLVFGAAMVNSLIAGGWKAATLSLRWGTDGSLTWAWGWLTLYAAFGGLMALEVIRLLAS